MACGNCGCGSQGDTKVKGCQSNGGCSSGGCNRLNVFNWLADIPLSELGKPYHIVELSFNNGSRKDFFRNDHRIHLEKGTYVTVEGASGFDVGQVSLTGELVKLQMKKYGVNENSEIKKLLRVSTTHDIEVFRNAKAKEKDILILSRAIAKSLNLEMKIAEAEIQADSKKICFFYTADSRVDFRELIKVYASEFKAKIEMRQIGARQESAKVGGIGSCGRELCCSSWLTDFKTVNTTTARYQNLSINQAKLSGQCGRLKCCLNYELDTYMDALKVFPDRADHLELESGKAFLIKKDIFRNLMWYGLAGSSRQYPLSIERVNTILEMNARGQKAAELEAVEIVSTSRHNVQKTVDAGFVNDVGQVTLSALNKSSKKKKHTQNSGGNNNEQRNAQSGGNSRNRPKNRSGSGKGQGEKNANATASQQSKPQHNNAPKGEKNANAPKNTSRDKKQGPPRNRPDNHPKREQKPKNNNTNEKS